MSTVAFNRQQSRDVDRRAIEEFGMSGLVLMENAGRGVVDLLVALGMAGPVLVACGRGNNAGDGFVIARHLDLRGYQVRVALCGAPVDFTPDARANHEILQRAGVSMTSLVEADGAPMDRQVAGDALRALVAGTSWLVDALLGTGARGEPRPPLDTVIETLNAAGAPILAIDVPSGLDCDTGIAARNTIRATHTATFVAKKIGFLAAGSERFTGQVHVLDIGAPRRLIDEVLRATRR
ncbi:MAG: NAD(P)H-hydrate epimerase [Pirellulales bacterium]|nr:NAD(P)H-hydrate epimerase [Pirellulales bacterium]